jgi:multiple sugar transport system substrate-binding protein
MKSTFLAIFSGLVLLSIIAWEMRPERANSGKIPLIWVSDDNPARRDQVRLFNQLNPEYELRLDPDNTGVQKIIVQSLASVGPDLFDCYTGYQLSAFVKAGIAWDVTDEMKAAGIEVHGNVWEVGLPTCSIGDRVYGFPTNTGVHAIWFNKDLFDAASMPYPQSGWTWDDLIETARKLTLREKNGRPVQFGLLTSFGNFPMITFQNGGRVYNETGTRCLLDRPEAIAGAEFLQDLVYKHKITPTPVEEVGMATEGGWGSGISFMPYLAARKAAMLMDGRYCLTVFRKYKNLRLGIVPIPFGKYKIYTGYSRSTLVNKNSPRRKEALVFLKYLASKEYNDLVNRQADGMSPVKKYTDSDEFLHNPEHPEEDYNHIWREVMPYGVPEQISPFVNGNVADRIILRQRELARNNQKSAAEAMRTIAEQINAEIAKNITTDPTLRELYEALQKSAPDTSR